MKNGTFIESPTATKLSPRTIQRPSNRQIQTTPNSHMPTPSWQCLPIKTKLLPTPIHPLIIPYPLFLVIKSTRVHHPRRYLSELRYQIFYPEIFGDL